MNVRTLLLVFLSVLSLGVLAAPPIGQVKTLEGTAHILRDGSRLPATIGAMVLASDTIVTGEDGTVGITFIDNSRFSAGPGTEFSLDQFSFNTTTHEGEFHSRVNRGTLTVVSGKLVKENPGAMTVKTPSALLGVRGTTFLVRVGSKQ